MKKAIEHVVEQAVKQLQQQAIIPQDVEYSIHIEHTKDKQFGDYACNIAMVLAKLAKQKPRDLAEKIIENLDRPTWLTKIEIAGPGFINFYLSSAAQQQVISEILTKAEKFGQSTTGANKTILLEFVSANPTGPLHVGHGRGAAYGASLANLLTTVGYKVHREYYVNDAGRQMDILAVSVWLRYLALLDAQFAFPSNGYKGEYVIDIAKALLQQYGDRFKHPIDTIFKDVPADATETGGDKEAHIDGLITNAKQILGADNYQLVHSIGLNNILADIKNDLEEFGVVFDEWYSEKSLATSGALQKGIDSIQASGHCYTKDGALWFRTTDFGDEKDRVVVRENGQGTYLASDIAYHLDKINRGNDLLIDIVGADHHGYIARLRATLQAHQIDPDRLKALLVQFAILYRGQTRVQMSTRSGSFVTLRELREEVGNDAARFFYVMRRCEQHMDFDLDLAKSQSNDNPVYYIQYAHARVCSVMRQLKEKGWQWDEAQGLANISQLTDSYETTLMDTLGRYPEILEFSASNFEPHNIAHYLRDLANDFHAYYNARQFLVDDDKMRNSRLCLISAVRQVIANGLKILGVSTPEVM